MESTVFRFEVVDKATRKSPIKPDSTTNVPSSTPAKPVEPPTNDSDTNEGIYAFGKRAAENSIERFAVSPLNTATGGLASPIYGLGKAMVSGASAGAIGGAIAGILMAGVQLAINSVQKRVTALEAQVSEANERDNNMIRAGAKLQASFYDYKFFGGVHRTNRN